jgi:hypothetical protein
MLQEGDRKGLRGVDRAGVRLFNLPPGSTLRRGPNGMAGRILVACTTKHGSTTGIAEVVAPRPRGVRPAAPGGDLCNLEAIGAWAQSLSPLSSGEAGIPRFMLFHISPGLHHLPRGSTSLTSSGLSTTPQATLDLHLFPDALHLVENPARCSLERMSGATNAGEIPC